MLIMLTFLFAASEQPIADFVKEARSADFGKYALYNPRTEVFLPKGQHSAQTEEVSLFPLNTPQVSRCVLVTNGEVGRENFLDLLELGRKAEYWSNVNQTLNLENFSAIRHEDGTLVLIGPYSEFSDNDLNTSLLNPWPEGAEFTQNLAAQRKDKDMPTIIRAS